MSEGNIDDEARRIISRQIEKLERHYPDHGTGDFELAHEMYQGVIYLEVFFRATARHGHKTIAVAHGGSRDEVFFALVPRLYMREVRFKIEEHGKDRDFRMWKRRIGFVSRPSPLRQGWTA
ncbi:hypothetical protein BFW01_g10833 [Lasiodiplodia theobromae]|uniref:Uncharacterized protein n=1 Tax=Lasiodiplodia theobromae TaxID=45133 RepID=A0A8H7M9P2_9PEZI|nr:hypothetical protein BFW01_g10833 [Lasiodiplodia theobromae]